jgi:hypothetical protein
VLLKVYHETKRLREIPVLQGARWTLPKTEKGSVTKMTMQQAFEEDCRATCRNVRDTIEKIVEGTYVPDKEWSDENEDSEYTLYDYFEDALDIEFRISSRKELQSVEICVTCGGPNIYIDTKTKAVELYWGNTHCDMPLSRAATEVINGYAEELYASLG